MAIVLPIGMQSLLSALVSASDALMLGFLDQSSLSAISLATQVQFVLSLFQAAFMIGASVLAAQYWGIHDKETVEHVLGLSLRTSIPVSAVFFAAALWAPEWLMRIFTNEQELILLGAPYLQIVSVSYLLMGISQMYLNIMKNSGRVTRSAVYSSTAVVANIILNVILIFGLFGAPKLGITGAAVATVISRVIELVLCLWENRDRGHVRIRWKYIIRTNKELKRRYHHHMMPVLGNEIVWGVGFTMFSVIMGHLGNDAVAANSIANIVKNILTSFCVGLGAGSAILIGNLLGAGELDKAKLYSRRLIKASVLFGTVAGLLILVISPVILKVSHTLTDQARTYLRIMLYISTYYVIGKSSNGVLIEGTFCAGGDTRFGLICDFINMWCVIIPLASLGAFVWKWPVMVVYFVLNLDEIGKIPFELWHYRKYRWLNNLTEKEQQ
ncbi:MAG: MATE family efflux transporter [Lachnospiraceae bacterium]|nr:MATE family efflux transporter [Lachnospiraceae bacterium]